MTSNPSPAKTIIVDRLRVEQYRDRDKMGAAAAYAVAARMKAIIADEGCVSVVFASAPSQNEFLANLAAARGLAWDKVIAFHLDEYIGLDADAPQGFGNFLRERLFNQVKPAEVHYLDGQADDPEQACLEYATLLARHPVDIVCAGIGENGHLAFNDPPVADFDDPLQVKVVELDATCRMQQVNDGCFASIDLVPTHALTMTMSALMDARYIYTMVPGPTKAQAVRDTLTGPVGTQCPATVLRRHPASILYIDADAAALL